MTGNLVFNIFRKKANMQYAPVCSVRVEEQFERKRIKLNKYANLQFINETKDEKTQI